MTIRSWNLIALSIVTLALACGCFRSKRSNTIPLPSTAMPSPLAVEEPQLAVQPAAFDHDSIDGVPQQPSNAPANNSLVPSPGPELLPSTNVVRASGPLGLEEVVSSIYTTYPLLQSAMYSRDIATGNHLAAHGGFDLKLKAASENGPVGFYKTYRQSLGFVQPLYSGSEVWGGYRIGRGNFQPWYLERQTNDAGEFKAGISVPLLQNRTIDERRAELWRTGLESQLAEFDIQAQVIGFIQEASYAYWEWVAAGRGQAIASRVLDLAASRTERIRQQVEAGLIDPPELTDNLRLIADRRAKLADATRKLQQKAAKLSLYLRDEFGQPIVPTADRLPPLPDPSLIDTNQFNDDVTRALANRPDLQVIDTLWQQFDVDLEQAYNQLQPDVSAVMWGSQDIGGPTSSKRDKSPFEMEAGVYVDVPMQRRKAQGKITALEAKMQQLMAKRRMTEDKISVGVQSAYAALTAAYERVQQTREAVKFAEELARREYMNFEAGASDMLKVTLREQYAAESAMKELDALLEYHQARADYRAVLAADVVQ